VALRHKISEVLEHAAPKLWLNLNILRRNRNFEPEYWLLPQFCRRNSISIDVGGNRGWFAYYMARLSRQVHVFEPNPICLRQLARYKTANIKVHPFALSDAPGTAKMRFDPDNTGIGTIEPANTLTDNPGINRIVQIDVPVRTLDSFGFDNVAFVKIDVEGHEPAVLRGARGMLTASRPCLLVELVLYHNRHVFDEVWDVLDPMGYRMWACTRQGLAPVDRAEVPKLQIGRPETNPDYVYNFVFIPEHRTHSRVI